MWCATSRDCQYSSGTKLVCTKKQFNIRKAMVNKTRWIFSPRRSPRRLTFFSWVLKYKVDFLFRSFIFSWERFWRPRKVRLASSRPRSIPHLLRRPPHPRPPPSWSGRKLQERAARPSTKFGFCEQPSLASPEVTGNWQLCLYHPKRWLVGGFLSLFPNRDLKRFPGCGVWLPKPPSPCAVFVATMFRRLTLSHLLFTTILGIAGGVYIFQPVFEQYAKDQKELKVQLVQESEEKKS